MVVEKRQILYGSDVAAPTILRDLRSKSATDGTSSVITVDFRHSICHNTV